MYLTLTMDFLESCRESCLPNLTFAATLPLDDIDNCMSTFAEKINSKKIFLLVTSSNRQGTIAIK